MDGTELGSRRVGSVKAAVNLFDDKIADTDDSPSLKKTQMDFSVVCLCLDYIYLYIFLVPIKCVKYDFDIHKILSLIHVHLVIFHHSVI